VINLPPLFLDILNFIVRAQRGAERAENQVERSGAVSGSCRKTMERSGARSGKQGAVVTEKGWSAVGLFRRSRSAHVL